MIEPARNHLFGDGAGWRDAYAYLRLYGVGERSSCASPEPYEDGQ